MNQALTREDVERMAAAASAGRDDYTTRVCATLLCRTHKTETEEFCSGRHDPAVLASAQWIASRLGKKLCASL